MDSKERNCLSGGIAICDAEQRQREHHKEAQNQSGDCQVNMGRRRAGGNAQQQNHDTDQCNEGTPDPQFLHV
jgi:hypothetical protein